MNYGKYTVFVFPEIQFPPRFVSARRRTRNMYEAELFISITVYRVCMYHASSFFISPKYYICLPFRRSADAGDVYKSHHSLNPCKNFIYYLRKLNGNSFSEWSGGNISREYHHNVM